MDAVDARLDAAVVSRSLAAALASLSASEREVLLLYAWTELTYEEIAEALGIPVGTVRSRLHRARAALRETLERHGVTDAVAEPAPAEEVE